VKELKNRDTEFHIYKPKQEKNFKIVLKHIHATAYLDDIKKEIENLGHIVTNIWNIKKQGKKKALFTFYVEKPGSNNKDIYKVVSLLECRLKLEPSHEIPQYNNCQQYGHINSFRKARCVKCTKDYPNFNYLCKKKSKDVKCV
jgi:hypothetical protein